MHHHHSWDDVMGKSTCMRVNVMLGWFVTLCKQVRPGWAGLGWELSCGAAPTALPPHAVRQCRRASSGAQRWGLAPALSAAAVQAHGYGVMSCHAVSCPGLVPHGAAHQHCHCHGFRHTAAAVDDAVRCCGDGLATRPPRRAAGSAACGASLLLKGTVAAGWVQHGDRGSGNAVAPLHMFSPAYKCAAWLSPGPGPRPEPQKGGWVGGRKGNAAAAEPLKAEPGRASAQKRMQGSSPTTNSHTSSAWPNPWPTPSPSRHSGSSHHASACPIPQHMHTSTQHRHKTQGAAAGPHAGASANARWLP